MFKQSYLVGSAALLLAVVACDSSTSPSGGISLEAASELAVAMDMTSNLGTGDFGLGPSFSIGVDGSGASASTAVPTTFNNSFTTTKACHKGGSAAIDGTIAGNGDPATHSLTLDVNATRTDANCALQTRDGIVTINGNPNLAYTAHLNIVNAALVGPQTQTHKGSFTWARTGGSGSCDVDLTSSYDHATQIVTVAGSFCGHIVNVVRQYGTIE